MADECYGGPATAGRATRPVRSSRDDAARQPTHRRTRRRSRRRTDARRSCSCATPSPRRPVRCSRAARPASISPSKGIEQARAPGERLAALPIAAVYASPIERTTQTAEHIAGHHGLEVQPLAGVIEADYGEWTGGKIADLAKTDVWKVVQRAPSRAAFPGGESIAEMQARMVDRARGGRRRASRARPSSSCRTPIRSSRRSRTTPGVHLDLFQRIAVSPASVTVFDVRSVTARCW